MSYHCRKRFIVSTSQADADWAATQIGAHQRHVSYLASGSLALLLASLALWTCQLCFGLFSESSMSTGSYLVWQRILGEYPVFESAGMQNIFFWLLELPFPVLLGGVLGSAGILGSLISRSSSMSAR